MKMFKKVIALAVSAVMLMSCTAFAASTSWDINQTNEKVEVTVECGEDKANALVAVQVFKPASGGYEELNVEGNYTATAVNDVISYSYIHQADSEGKITFTYKPQAPTDEKYGEYYVRVVGREAGYFEYKTDIDKERIVNNIKDAGTVASVADLFTAGATEKVYTKSERLELETNLSFYADMEAADSATKTNIYEYVVARLDEVTTVAEFYTLFDKAIFVCVLDAKTEAELGAYIETNKVYAGIDTSKVYTDVIDTTGLYYSASNTEVALAELAATDLSETDFEEATLAITNAYVNALISTAESNSRMDEIILHFEDEIEVAGGDVDTYKETTTRLAIALKLIQEKPFNNLYDFASRLNGLMDGNGSNTQTPSAPGGIIVDTPSAPAGNGGNGGNGGGGFGSGASISRPVPSTNIYTEGAGTTPATTVFTDLGNHAWAEQAIKTLKDKNIINGKTPTEFKPEDTVLREEFAKMIMLTVLSANVGSATGTSFADVDASAWYAPYIAAATNSGVINGFSETEFGIGNTIRREDMAVMCYRAIKAAGITLTAEREAAKFTDGISDYAKEAITVMYAAGLINGYSETEFNANGTATRAEAAMILYNVVQKYGAR